VTPGETLQSSGSPQRARDSTTPVFTCQGAYRSSGNRLNVADSQSARDSTTPVFTCQGTPSTSGEPESAFQSSLTAARDYNRLFLAVKSLLAFFTSSSKSGNSRGKRMPGQRVSRDLGPPSSCRFAGCPLKRSGATRLGKQSPGLRTHVPPDQSIETLSNSCEPLYNPQR
jgi:hypothetical protein